MRLLLTATCWALALAGGRAQPTEMDKTAENYVKLVLAVGQHDPDCVDAYEVQRLVEQLAYAGNEAARRYLNGEFTREQAAAWLERYALMPNDRAAQRVRFFDQYRSYVINYNLGKDLVRTYIESRGGTPDRPATRWEAFGKLLSSPRLPSGLQ